MLGNLWILDFLTKVFSYRSRAPEKLEFCRRFDICGTNLTEIIPQHIDVDRNVPTFSVILGTLGIWFFMIWLFVILRLLENYFQIFILWDPENMDKLICYMSPFVEILWTVRSTVSWHLLLGTGTGYSPWHRSLMIRPPPKLSHLTRPRANSVQESDTPSGESLTCLCKSTNKHRYPDMGQHLYRDNTHLRY